MFKAKEKKVNHRKLEKSNEPAENEKAEKRTKKTKLIYKVS